LKGAVFDKRLLDGMENIIGRKTFNGLNIGTLYLPDKCIATRKREAINQDRTSTTGAQVARELGPGQANAFPQEIN